MIFEENIFGFIEETELKKFPIHFSNFHYRSEFLNLNENFIFDCECIHSDQNVNRQANYVLNDWKRINFFNLSFLIDFPELVHDKIFHYFQTPNHYFIYRLNEDYDLKNYFSITDQFKFKDIFKFKNLFFKKLEIKKHEKIFKIFLESFGFIYKWKEITLDFKNNNVILIDYDEILKRKNQ